MTHRKIERQILVPYEHQAYFTESVFESDNRLLASLIETERRASRVFVVVDSAVSSFFPGLKTNVEAYFQNYCQKIHLVGYVEFSGGEEVKNSQTCLQTLYEHIHAAQLCRHSYIIAIGGGALLDMIGYAAATAHRGIRLIRIPTTSLSQADGGVGVKNGINFKGKKNFIGTFAPPYAIINDFNFLETLSDAQLRDGFIEAIKVALIKDSGFFDQIEARADQLLSREKKAVQWIIETSAHFHIEHIATCGDPFERTTARPLDFGHWLAHKLESLSDFRLSHGTAVAVGIAVDVLYSEWSGHLDPVQTRRILDLIKKFGFETYHPLLETLDPSGQLIVLQGLDEFREHLGGELTISLLSSIGTAFDTHIIEHKGIIECLSQLKSAEAPIEAR